MRRPARKARRLRISGNIRWRSNAARGDASPVECRRELHHGLLEAIGVAGRFDGLPNATGERVDVRSELMQLQERVDPGVRWYVDLEIRKLSDRQR